MFEFESLEKNIIMHMLLLLQMTVYELPMPIFLLTNLIMTSCLCIISLF